MDGNGAVPSPQPCVLRLDGASLRVGLGPGGLRAIVVDAQVQVVIPLTPEAARKVAGALMGITISSQLPDEPG